MGEARPQGGSVGERVYVEVKSEVRYYEDWEDALDCVLVRGDEEEW